MVLEPEPELVTDPTLMEVLDELRAREPLFHRRELGTTRSHFEAMTTEDFWEVGASGCAYSREYVLDILEERYQRTDADVWETSDFYCRRIGLDVYLLTYTLRQGERVTRRSTLWEPHDRAVEGAVSPRHCRSSHPTAHIRLTHGRRHSLGDIVDDRRMRMVIATVTRGVIQGRLIGCWGQAIGRGAGHSRELDAVLVPNCVQAIPWQGRCWSLPRAGHRRRGVGAGSSPGTIERRYDERSATDRDRCPDRRSVSRRGP